MEENKNAPIISNETATELDAMEDNVLPEVSSECDVKKDTDREKAESKEDYKVDYEDIARRDISELKAEFPELSDTESITELENPIRYAALRDLGLSPSEAYFATTKRRPRQDNRSHLERSVPRGASVPRGSMSEAELRAAREIFSDISDSEIRSLYKRVTQ